MIFIYYGAHIIRYGPWMDTNMVIPTGVQTCTVIYDYFLEKMTIESLGKEKDTFIDASLKASDQVETDEIVWLVWYLNFWLQVQQEDNMICESVQVGLQSTAYDMGRYAPGVEMADHTFHQTLAKQLRDIIEQGK